MSDLTTQEREDVAGFAKWWWLWLVTGVAWFIVALSILQFDSASVQLVGWIIGFMFLAAGIEQFVNSRLVGGWRWVWVLFGVLFIVAGLWALFNPASTVAAVADSLGFLFLLVAIFWIIEAFATKADNDLWWLGLVTGVIMLALAFWVAGQFNIEREYVLLVFAGIWSLMQGITSVIRAFVIRKVGKIITDA